jgi:hypothetical protein
MKRGRRVARINWKAGVGQPQGSAVRHTSGTATLGNPQESLLRQARQPRQAHSENLYRREANPSDFEHVTTSVSYANNVSFHVSIENEADVPDVADGSRESAAFRHGAVPDRCPTDRVVRLTEPHVATCSRCNRPLIERELVHIGYDQWLHHACGRWVRRQSPASPQRRD